MNAQFEALEKAVELSRKLSQAAIELIISLLAENAGLKRRIAELEAKEIPDEEKDSH